MNVLCVAPHPDDESIGCGGALALHADKGDRTIVVFLTSGELGLKDRPREEAWRIREGEAAAAAKVLGLSELKFLRLPDWMLNEHVDQSAEQLSSVIKATRPELIYLPHPQEWHPDHKAAVAITQQCLKSPGISPELRSYEVWTPIQEHNHVLDITPVWERKLAALRAYASQLAQWPYERAIQGLNQYRGAMVGRCSYAEVFA